MFHKVPAGLMHVLELDLLNKKYRIAANYVFFKTGTWRPIEKIVKIYLVYENSTVSGSVRMLKHSRTFRFFPLSLIKANGSTIHLRNFIDYREDRKVFTKLKNLLNIEPEDKYAVLQKSAVERRERKR